jgi:hypothetical protein
MLTDCPVVVILTHWRPSAYKLPSATVMTLCRQPSTLQPVIMKREVSSCTAVLSYCRDFELHYFGKFTSRGRWRRVARPVDTDVSVDLIVFNFRPWNDDTTIVRNMGNHTNSDTASNTAVRPLNLVFGLILLRSGLEVTGTTRFKLSTWTYNICGHRSVWHWFSVARQPS